MLLDAFLSGDDLDIPDCTAKTFPVEDVVDLGSVISRAVGYEVRVYLLEQGVSDEKFISNGKLKNSLTIHISYTKPITTMRLIVDARFRSDMAIPVP